MNNWTVQMTSCKPCEPCIVLWLFHKDKQGCLPWHGCISVPYSFVGKKVGWNHHILILARKRRKHSARTRQHKSDSCLCLSATDSHVFLLIWHCHKWKCTHRFYSRVGLEHISKSECDIVFTVWHKAYGFISKTALCGRCRVTQPTVSSHALHSHRRSLCLNESVTGNENISE